MIRIKRVYSPRSRRDGQRFLVDRLWPRGLSREKAALSGWIREAGPSPGLRKWFGHDPRKWDVFQRRFKEELSGRPLVLKPLLEAAKKGTLTLLFAAKDEEHNNAVVLKRFLSKRIGP